MAKSLLDLLDQRFGRYAMPNVTLWLIAAQVIVYVAARLRPGGGALGGQAAVEVFEQLALDPERVLAGEPWRLLTFLFLAPLFSHPVFVIFFWWFFYFMGTVLETTWGAFRYGVFLATGWLATIAASMAAHFAAPGAGAGFGDYLYGSVFLAFARLHPEFVMYVLFVLPVKIKWLARIQWAFYALVFLFGDWRSRLLALAATLNFALYFGRDVWRDVKSGRRQMLRQAKTLQSPSAIAHECRVCGLTSAMAPKAAFRYCSQCAGQCCYCPDHLREHEHVVERNDQ